MTYKEIWTHVECEGISVESYDKFNADVSNVSYYCEANHCNSHVK